MGIVEKIQAKLELFRLEKRYTRHRHRRSTFQSNAIYVDGEYVYQTPNMTGSSTVSSPTSTTSASTVASPTVGRASAMHFEPMSPTSQSSHSTTWSEARKNKRANRMSMPAFGNGLEFERPEVKSQESRW